MGGWSPGYRVSKAAMNAMTRILSTELKDEGILVNSACPGFVNTDMGGPMGAQKPVEDGASGIVWLATLPDDGPDGRVLPRRPAGGVLSPVGARFLLEHEKRRGVEQSGSSSGS